MTGVLRVDAKQLNAYTAEYATKHADAAATVVRSQLQVLFDAETVVSFQHSVHVPALMQFSRSHSLAPGIATSLHACSTDTCVAEAIQPAVTAHRHEGTWAASCVCATDSSLLSHCTCKTCIQQLWCCAAGDVQPEQTQLQW